MRIEKIAQKILAGTLSVMMVFSSVPTSVLAQEVIDGNEPTPEPTVEVVEQQEPGVNEEEQPEPTPEVSEESTPEPTVEPTVTPTVEPTVEPTVTPTVTPEPEQPSPTSTPSAEQQEKDVEEDEEEEESDKDDKDLEVIKVDLFDVEETEDENESNFVVYRASSVADFAVAVSELTDDVSRRLVVETGQDLSNVLTSGKAAFYDNTYIIEFDSNEDRDLAESIVSDFLLVGGHVSKDAGIGLSSLSQEEGGTEENIPADNSEEETPKEEINEESLAPTAETSLDETPSEENVPSEESEPVNNQEENNQEEENLEENKNEEGVFDISPDALSVAENGLLLESSHKVVALIDTGAYGDLADASVILTEEQEITADSHGTAMASIIKGLSPETSILSIKAFTNNGSGSVANVTAAVRYATEAGVDIINISASMRDSEEAAPLRLAIEDALSAGIIVVAAAGNFGADASGFIPANIEGVDTIGAVYPLDGLSAFAVAPFSNYGPAVNYWYIAESTSEAAANETGILCAGKEDLGWDATNSWYRFTKVKYQDGGASENADTYYSGFYKELIASKNLNPPGSGNLDADRSNAHWAGDHYEGTTFSWNGVPVVCNDSSKYADYDADYQLNVSTSTSYHDETVSYSGPTMFVSAGIEYVGTVYTHRVHLNPDHVDPLVPGYEYHFDNVPSMGIQGNADAHLSADGYYVASITAGNGNVNAVSARISGDQLIVYVDPNEPDMPDEVEIWIQTDKKEIGSCTYHFETITVTGATLSAGANDQTFDVPGYGGGSETHQIGEPDCTDTHLYGRTRLTFNIVRGGFTLDKDDLNRINTNHGSQPEGTGDTGQSQGDATLEDTKYQIINTRNNHVVIEFTTNKFGTPKEVTYTADGAHASVTTSYSRDGSKAKTALAADALKYGDYYVREIQPPEGYFLNEDWSYYFEVREQSITPSGGSYIATDGKIYDSVVDITAPARGGGIISQQVYRSDIKLTKFDTDRYATDVGIIAGPDDNEPQDDGETANTPQGDATLAGAQYTVYNVSKDEIYLYDEDEIYPNRGDGSGEVGNRWVPTGTIPTGDARYTAENIVMVLTVDEQGFVYTVGQALPYGTYAVKETRSPAGYMPNDAWCVVINIRADGETYDLVNLASAGYVQSKTEASSDHSIANPNSNNHDYIYDYISRSAGSFTRAFTDEITNNYQIDDVIRGGVQFKKVDALGLRTNLRKATADSLGGTLPQGDATLEGAHISIYNNSERNVLVNGRWYEPGEEVAVLVTNEDGEAISSDDLLPYGTYYALETQAPVGYLINKTWRADFEIREDKEIVDCRDNTINDNIARGDVRVYKYDWELNTSEAMDGASHDPGSISEEETLHPHLNTIAFDIYNRSLTNIIYSEVVGTDTEPETRYYEIAPGEFVTRIYTYYNEDVQAYVAETTDNNLPYGTYSIVEVGSKNSWEDGDGNPNLHHRMDDEEVADSTNDAYMFDDRTERYFQIGEHHYGPVTLDTSDEEVYGLIYDFGSSVDDRDFKTDLSYVDPGTAEAHENFPTPAERLTYITYDSQGKSVVNHVQAIWPFDGQTGVVDVSNPMSDLQEKNGTLRKQTGDAELDKTMIFKNEVRRNDFYFHKKKNAQSDEPLQTMWIVTNVTSGERHVIVTDESGNYDSSYRNHDRATNYNDRFLPMIDQGVTVDLSYAADNQGLGPVKVDSGTWFGIGEDGTPSEPNNAKGALPYGKYILTEVMTNTTVGCKMLQKKYLKIYSDKQYSPNPIDFGNLINTPIVLTSTAVEIETGSKYWRAGDPLVIKDIVTYEGILDEDTHQDYVLVGKIMNQKTGKFLVDEEGKEIRAIQELTINANDGSIVQEFPEIQTTDLDGTSIVCYEYLYKKADWEAEKEAEALASSQPSNPDEEHD